MKLIGDPYFQTMLFFVILAASLLFWKKREGETVLSVSRSQELKGFAILAVVFAHIGYLLVSDQSFLFPLSTLAGVGVDLFLLLSGYGLTFSALRHSRPISEFYLRHARKIYLPLWVTLSVFFIADYFLLARSYDLAYIARSFAGYFPSADIFLDVNSPLWYFTWILFFYIAFPLLFSKRLPWLSAFVMGGFAHYLPIVLAPYMPDVVHLYELHTYAFPLGMFLAWLFTKYEPRLDIKNTLVRLTVLGLLVLAVWYLAVHSAVGTSFEQYISLLTAGLVILFFILKENISTVFELFGKYSYEIYLLHVPLIFRYDIFYANIPASIATVSTLALCLAAAYGLNRLKLIK